MSDTTTTSAAAAGATEEFLRHRPLLFGIAYRMLGSAADAEDAVQETWMRWSEAGEEARSPRAWLATTITRLCIDQLRSARARREQYVGPWLPEPLVGEVDAGPEEGPLREESISTAFLLLLESLSPTERAVFLLREVFDFDYPQVARAVGKSEAACRQILHRARERLAAGRARFDADRTHARELAQGFVHAIATGDLDALLGMLTDDAVSVGDGGGLVPAGMRPVLGPDKVARLWLGLANKYGTEGEFRFTEVNGAPGLVVFRGGAVYSVMSFAFRGGRIAGVYTVVNPHKLAHVGQAFGTSVSTPDGRVEDGESRGSSSSTARRPTRLGRRPQATRPRRADIAASAGDYDAGIWSDLPPWLRVAAGPCRAAKVSKSEVGRCGLFSRRPGAWQDERNGEKHEGRRGFPPARAVPGRFGWRRGRWTSGQRRGAMTEPVRWIEVATFRAVYEADMAVETLENAGIPAQVGGGEHVGIFGAGYQGPTTRGVAVLVPSHRAEEARELLLDEPPEA